MMLLIISTWLGNSNTDDMWDSVYGGECRTAPSGCRPLDQASQPTCTVSLPVVCNGVHRHYHLVLLSPKADLILPSQRTEVKVCGPCPRLYVRVAFTINIQLSTVEFDPGISCIAVRQPEMTRHYVDLVI